jgi:ABC-type Fe3+-hydroxamate transport system substrate-binding protein
MPDFIDQTGQTITIHSPVQRIVSLVPSQTELLYDLGLDEKVVGITKFCVHPDTWFRTKTRVGGTKQLKSSVIHELKPDLVIANKEENVKEQVEELMNHYPVWISDINNLTDAYEMIEQIGLLTEKEKPAKKIINQIKNNFSQLQTPNPKPKIAYLIWQKPYMTVGGDTFIHAMLEQAGFTNVFADAKRYPEITMEELKARNTELLLLSSEPFPFQQKHIDALQQLLPAVQILLVDGELFSWYGSRLQYTAAYIQRLWENLST